MSRSTVVLGALVLALLAISIGTSLKLVKLQEQVAKLEERQGGASVPAGGTAGSQVASGGAKDSTGTATAGNGAVSDAGTANGNTSPGSDSPAGGGGTGRKPAARATDGTLSEKDIEAMIEKKLAAHDQKNPLATFMNFEDPMVVMERELKLSSIQKTRIQQHIKERDEATMELYQAPEARKDWKAAEEKATELRKTCDESVKRELDLAQQDKYEELKKSGKLMDFGSGGGMSIMIGGPATKEDDPANPDPAGGK
ncbi:MAG: hypothetical protein K8T20_09175 [Planctomycetes bacterium]|nr:hypothetical protein [Planctomycetota bacterium]